MPTRTERTEASGEAQMRLFEMHGGGHALPYSASLLKSATQKAVRRGRADCAAACLKSLLLKDGSAATRRLPIIVMEDALLHPGFAELIRLMTVASGRSGLTTPQHEWVLRVGAAAAIVEVRDPPPAIHPLRGAPVGELSRLPAAEAELVRALRQRAAAGGMRYDRGMLREYAGIWFQRFVSGEWSVDRLAHVWSPAWAKTERYAWDSVAPAGPADILPEAVDFHCTSIVTWLLNRPAIRQMVADAFPTRGADRVLQTVIWLTRSSINLKTMIGFDRPWDWERDAPVAWGEGTHEKLKRIGAAIEPHLNCYAELVRRVV